MDRGLLEMTPEQVKAAIPDYHEAVNQLVIRDIVCALRERGGDDLGGLILAADLISRLLVAEDAWAEENNDEKPDIDYADFIKSERDEMYQLANSNAHGDLSDALRLYHLVP